MGGSRVLVQRVSEAGVASRPNNSQAPQLPGGVKECGGSGLIAYLNRFISVGTQPLRVIFKSHGVDALGLEQFGRTTQGLQLTSLAVHFEQVEVLISRGGGGGRAVCGREGQRLCQGGGARGLILVTFLAFASAQGPGRSMDKITHAPSMSSSSAQCRSMQVYI